jgi:hypothetical protein
MAGKSTGYGDPELTLDAIAKAKRLPVGFLSGLGMYDLAGGVAVPYYGATGEEIAVKRRTALRAAEGSYWPKGLPLAAYGQWRVDYTAKAGFLILVEGESDCWALWYHGMPALGIPGANATNTLLRAHIEAVVTIYVHQEPDSGGEAFVAGVRRRLAALRFIGKVFVLRMPDAVKDPADLHVLDADKFKARLETAIAASEPLALPGTAEQNGQTEQSKPAGSPALPKKGTRFVPYHSFPVEALPEPIRGFVREGALALGCDPAYLALPALAVAAGLVGYTRVLRLKRSWRVPSVLWTLVVADSGSLKTPAFRLATDHLFTMQKHLDSEFKGQHAQYAEAKEKWKAAAKAAREAGETVLDEPEPPVCRTVFTSDATIEAVAELIDENPRGLFVACDELAAWLGSFTRYKGRAGGTDLPRWLSMHSAGGFAYHRKTGDHRRIVVPHAAVSVTGGVQPGVMARAMAGEFMEAGGGGRLFLAMPPRPVKEWTELEIDRETEERYHALLEALFAVEFYQRDGREVPHILQLAPEAKAAWVRFYSGWAKEQAAVEGELAAALSKLEEGAARFALIHHIVSRVGRGEDALVPIERESVDAGAVLCYWFANEARRIYGLLAESEEQRDTRRLVEFIQARGGAITARELQKSNSRKYQDADAAKVALDALVEAQLGEWVEPTRTKQGGQPARRFVLRPTPDSADTTSQEGDEDDGQPEPDPSGTTSDTTTLTPGFSAENGGSVGSVGRRTEDAGNGGGGEPGSPAGGGTAARGEVVSDGAGGDQGPSRRRRGKV